MSVTTRWRAWYDPGSASVSPVPMVIEHAEPGGVSCTTRNVVAGAVVDVAVEAGLLVEGLGPVDVADRQHHELELEVHRRPSSSGLRSVVTYNDGPGPDSSVDR